VRLNPFLPLLALLPLPLASQLGGSGTYAFLSQAPSARVLAMGGMINAMRDRDPALIHQNPALFNKEMDRRAVLNYVDHVSDINAGYAGYVQQLKPGRWGGVGFYYSDYGRIPGYDEGGNPTGDFRASENCIAFSYGHELNTQMALVVINLGFQLVTYGGGKREPLATDIQLGISHRLEHMPLRVHLVAHNLQQPDITYNQFLPNRNILDLGDDNQGARGNTLGDKMLRHLVVGGEFLLSKNWGLMFGYNHLRRREMSTDARKGTSGFSWGMTFRVERFQITYASAALFPGFNMNHFTFSFKPGDFKVKKSSTP